MKNDIRRSVFHFSHENNLNPWIVEAIIWQESNYRPDAVRLEDGFYDLYVDDMEPDVVEELCPRANNIAIQKILMSVSYGLMQIMGVVAYERGFRGMPEELFDIRTNILWGCRHLRFLYDFFQGDDRDIISAYNAGSPSDHNLNYVQSVEEKMKELRGNQNEYQVYT